MARRKSWASTLQGLLLLVKDKERLGNHRLEKHPLACSLRRVEQAIRQAQQILLLLRGMKTQDVFMWIT